VLVWSSELFVPPLLGPGPSRHTQKRLLSTPVLSDDVRGAWAGLSAGQLPPATKHWVTSFHSTAHCTPGHQNLYAPTNEFFWPACQVSDLEDSWVALDRPWVSTFTKLVWECAQEHHTLPLPSPWHCRAAWLVSIRCLAKFGDRGCAGRACAPWCEFWWEDIKPRGCAPWLGLRQKGVLNVDQAGRLQAWPETRIGIRTVAGKITSGTDRFSYTQLTITRALRQVQSFGLYQNQKFSLI